MADATSRTDLRAPGRANYGVDAPGIVIAYACVGIAALALQPSIGWSIWIALPCAALIAHFLWSSKVGKLRVRDEIISSIPWRGDEMVLDAGCDRGLLLIGAAKRLTTGRAVGLGLRRDYAQAGNRPAHALENARAEGVADRVEVQNGDMRYVPFPDDTFDVVLSGLVLHTIRDLRGRVRALREMARVLRPGGQLAAFDISNTEEYMRVLRRAGMSDVARSRPRILFFCPARTVTARKPAPRA